MKRIVLLSFLLLSALSAHAGFGIQAGAYSPTSGLEDNDNSLLLGVLLDFKLALFGIKLEGFYVDSSGRYGEELGSAFGETNVDMEAILAADFQYYPVGSTFFLQLGVNYISLDASDIPNINSEVIDNELGIEGGLGITLFDKLMVQGKIMYTPDAIGEDVASSIKDLDQNLMGFMVTAGWKF